MTPQLQRELWTSWASLLRSYAAVHGLGKDQHAVVEVSDAEVLVRFGQRSIRFTPELYVAPDGTTHPFALTVNGRARVGDDEDEMDLLAERLASEIINA
ncbi:MAG: hypothetical protein ACRYF4_07250 [Janthinobacterium lividum]